MINKIVYYLVLFSYVIFSLYVIKILLREGDQTRFKNFKLKDILFLFPTCFGISFFLMSFFRGFLPLSEDENFKTEIAIAIASGIINLIYGLFKINHINKEIEKIKELKREKEGYYDE